MTADDSVFPWGPGQPDPSVVYDLPITLIQLPNPRVTSVYTDEQKDELLESLKTEGQRVPVDCTFVDGQVLLSDGLNRIMALQQLGRPSVKAIVRPGSARDAQIGNLISARTRGKENPAETAEVIQDLRTKERMSDIEIRQRMGINPETFRKLTAIASLPSEVKELIRTGALGVGNAYELSRLEDPLQQIELAQKGVDWNWTVETMRAAVRLKQQPALPPQEVGRIFQPTGEVVIIKPKCSLCDNELAADVYTWQLHKECVEWMQQTYQRYLAYMQQQNAAPQG